MYKQTFLLLIIASLLLVSATPVLSNPLPSTLPTKQLAGPAQDILQGTMQLPDPAQTGLRSRSAMLPVTLALIDGAWTWEGQFPIDNADELTMLVSSPQAHQWDIRLQPAGQSWLSLAQARTALGLEQQAGEIGFDGNAYPAQVLHFAQAQPGLWRVRVTAPSANQAGKPEGYVLFSSQSPYRLYAHLNTHQLLVGQKVGLVAYAYNNYMQPDQGAPKGPLAKAITQASALINLPDGRHLKLAMADDGRHDDGVAGDGVYGALLTAELPGEYTAQVQIQGITPAGKAFMRTSQHVFPVIASQLALTGKAKATMLDTVRMQVKLEAKGNAPETVQAYAEVWGTGPKGMQPVAWIGGMVKPQATATGQWLPLTLDSRWIGLAGVRAPFELRNVRLQDPDTHLLLVQLKQAALATPRLPQAALTAPAQITDEMLMGPRPAQATRTNVYVGGAKLLLVHGYCSATNPWPTADFTGYAVFLDANQNRTHDYFAQLIGSFGSQYDSFGAVAHSQGGDASLHLYTYYWSGFDYATGSRLIQSVGTPYQGTALAGNLALIGEIFGIGCGTNWDLTYDGAALWLSGIPSWARSKVYYSTTSDTEVWWRWDYCNAASDPILDDPEDGVVEQWAGQLSGANNMGHKEGWCHTTSMRDPAQYTDHTRNVNMNTYAAR